MAKMKGTTAKARRMPAGSTIEQVSDDSQWVTLYEAFEGYGRDPKTFLLHWAESVEQDAGVKRLSLNSIALHHFLTEHASEFISDPEAFRIPTDDEDEIVDKLLLSVESESEEF